MTRTPVLVTAAGGIGDILRVTPLIRASAALGYEVDVLLAPDYLGTIELLRGAPEVRRLYYRPSSWCSERRESLDGLAEREYEFATFTRWSLPLREIVRTRNQFIFPQRQWLAEGDTACIRSIAAAIGWSEELPHPFAIPSSRKFDLPSGTVALHAGCKSGWPWKKWHGFDALAEMLPHVALVGSASDLHNDETYFRRDFRWPGHAVDFVGRLSLADTAALLAHCAALVSNDSGLMHLGVALGIPTFGIFGITSPGREMIPAPNMFAVTKGLACEPDCRRRPWGRRDCEFHLQCLKTLTAEEVFQRVTSVVEVFANG